MSIEILFANGILFLEILHRDLKPENFVFCPRDDCLKLIDFGIAQEIESHSVLVDDLVGTLVYMSPEQLTKTEQGKFNLSLASDIWAVGVILYELENRTLPFVDSDQKTLARMIVDNKFQYKSDTRDVIKSIIDVLLFRPSLMFRSVL